MTKREYRREHIIKLAILLGSIVIISVISGYIFFRVDLTADKRYTLSQVTHDIVNQLDEAVYVRVYLDGDLPAGFQKLRNSIREMLDEFRVISPQNIHYEFIDPADTDDAATRDDLFNQLYSKGVQPTMIDIAERGGGKSQRLVFPGALVSYKGREISVNFLKNNPALQAEQNLNNSMQNIEYELAGSLYALIEPEAKKVAFLEGHGELDEMLVSGISDALVRYYDIYRGRIDIDDIRGLDDYDALIVAKPLRPFSEYEKYIIDQYIMNGGKLMWFIDPVSIDLDSLTYDSQAIALISDLNLNDQLFRYGVRLNPNLIMDLNCLLIPLNVAHAGEPARFVPAPWYFSPLLQGNPTHPVTRDINYVKSEFASVIDTVSTGMPVKSTVLLQSSRNSRVINAPLVVNLEVAAREPDLTAFNMPGQPVAVLLEGQFKSLFANRMVTEIIGRDDPGFREKSKTTSMLVVSDGDIIRNDISVVDGIPEALPLGYDRYSGRQFGNREFVLNAANYLLDEIGLMELRTRELQLRLLDRTRVREQLLMWQVINIVLPVVVVIMFGVLYNFTRKKRYT